MERKEKPATKPSKNDGEDEEEEEEKEDKDVETMGPNQENFDRLQEGSLLPFACIVMLWGGSSQSCVLLGLTWRL